MLETLTPNKMQKDEKLQIFTGLKLIEIVIVPSIHRNGIKHVQVKILTSIRKLVSLQCRTKSRTTQYLIHHFITMLREFIKKKKLDSAAFKLHKGK